MADLPAVRAIVAGLGAGVTFETEDHLASVSVVGSGLSSNTAHVITRVEQILDGAGIPIRYVGTSALSITCVVPSAARDRAVGVLHTALVDSESTRPGTA